MGKLSALKIKSAPPGRHPDGEGLYLIVRDTGSRQWLLRIQSGGVRRDLGLGTAETTPRTKEAAAAAERIPVIDRRSLTLAEARDKAEAYRRMIMAGLDPAEERKKAPATTPTFEQATRDCHEEMKAGWRNDKHTKVWLACMETHVFPVIGDKPVDTIDSVTVRDLLAPIWMGKQETSRRVLQRIGVVLDFAHIKGWRPTETSLKSVRKGLPRHKRDDSHFNAMPYQDVPAFLAKLRDEVHTSGRDGLEFTILTAVRSNETRFARWPEINMKKATWTIPGERMKTGVTHVVPLAPAAIRILERRWEGRTENDGLVFFASPKKPMSDMTMTKALRDMGEKAAHVHGFRSTFTDWAAETTSTAKEVVDKALAHKLPDKVEAAYRRTNHLERRRVLMTMWADYLSGEKKVVRLAASS
ncbi:MULTISPECIES: site-specific integrase [unclassified Sphingomonas]|uniref:tyrosine-type recombinase/integrase n=1 Tax=unclassified Sphingomonas TaxID=196159 RepID=UPI0022697E0E|nr:MULTISPECIES: site-specific integrase [unclassified Sphingomonas]